MILVFHLKDYEEDMLQIEGKYAELWTEPDSNRLLWLVTTNDGGQDQIDAKRWILDEIAELRN